MDLDEFSSRLTGRYQALRIYNAIASHTGSKFTTGEITLLSGAIGADCSKELSRLAGMNLVKQVSRRGQYERVDVPFWDAVGLLAQSRSRAS